MPATRDGSGTVLAFDWGAKLIGVAVGNRIAGTARALSVLTNGASGPDLKRLDVLVQEWRPDAFVVGLPLALDGGEQAASTAARAFADSIATRYDRPTHRVDERYTSREAARRFAERRASGGARRKDAAGLDAVAAEIILEAWFADPGAPSP